MSRMSFAPAGGAAPAGTSRTVARTPAAGVAAINGTQNTLSWTSPNDGQLHTVEITSVLLVSSAETGGAWQIAYTCGGSARTQQLHAGGIGLAGNLAQLGVVCDPNTTVTVSQSSALTVGAATVYQTLNTDA